MENRTEQLRQALTAEGVVWLAGAVLRLAQLGVVVLWLPDSSVCHPAPGAWPHTALILALALAQAMLLPPLRVGRQSWYRQLTPLPGGAAPLPPSLAPLRDGWRCWHQAVRWRWMLWWRRLAVLLVTLLPAAMLWGGGNALSRQSAPVLPSFVLMVFGAAALAWGCLLTALWQCRYALTPLYLLDGHTAGDAMHLSVRAMRHHRREYIDLCGRCVLLPELWIHPRFRTRQTAWLMRRKNAASCGAVPAK